MHATPMFTVALNPRNSTRLDHLCRDQRISRGRLVNALLADILGSIEFKSGRDSAAGNNDEERTDA